MKRFTLLGCLLLLAAVAAGCGTTANNANGTNTSSNTNMNTNAAATPTPKAEATDMSSSPIVAQEKQIWDMIKTKNPDGFAAMLADDFLYVSNDGIYDKAGTVKGIKELDPTEITLSDWRVVELDDDASVVTYTVNMKGTSNGQPIPAGALRAASIWVNRGGKWVGIFHQDTPVVTEQMADSAGEEKPEAKPASTATAESHAAEPASEDPVAREKQVWDAIKKKDYDRFASFLADEQVEVSGTYVNNNKAETLKGIQGVDLSGGTLSDFKTLKIDDDAVVVTYVVKGPKPFPPAGMRATTAWTKRGDKWLAVYHQDTDIQAAMPKSK